MPLFSLGMSGTKLADIDMLSDARGWALSSHGQVLRTTDGGRICETSPHLYDRSVSSNVTVRAAFVDATHAFVAVGRIGKYAFSSVTLYATADGGLCLRSEPVPMPGWMPVQGLHRLGYMLLYAGAGAFSEPAELVRTRDGGIHFTIAAVGEPIGRRVALSGDKTGFGFAYAERGVVTGASAASTVFLDVTSNGGASWTHPILTVPKGLSAFGGGSETYPPDLFSTSIGVMPVAFYGQIVFYRAADGGFGWIHLRDTACPERRTDRRAAAQQRRRSGVDAHRARDAARQRRLRIRVARLRRGGWRLGLDRERRPCLGARQMKRGLGPASRFALYSETCAEPYHSIGTRVGIPITYLDAMTEGLFGDAQYLSATSACCLLKAGLYDLPVARLTATIHAAAPMPVHA